MGNVISRLYEMTIAFVYRQGHAVVSRPHDVARVAAVAEAKCMTDLVQAHVVKHHVAHERIFTDAAPDAGPESILVGPHGNRAPGCPLTILGSMRPSAASAAQGSHAKRSSAASS